MRPASSVRTGHSRALGLALALPALLLSVACERSVETPSEVIRASIEAHGGRTFDDVTIRWVFRDVPFEVTRQRGLFRYHRQVLDTEGEEVLEVMENAGTWIERAGQRESVDDQARRRIESAVNSVVYLGFLPFRLDDPAVRLADLGRTELEGQSYRKIEVTFQEEGGGRDWRDRFVYWFQEGDWTLDYLAYWEAIDPPVTRFRKAINRREVGGLLIQDYENYATVDDLDDIAQYDQLFETGGLRLVSLVEFDDVVVTAPAEWPGD